MKLHVVHKMGIILICVLRYFVWRRVLTVMYFTVWVFLFCIPGTGLQILLSGTGLEYQTRNSTCHTCSKFKEVLTFPRVIHIGHICMQTANCPVSGFSLRILEAGERCNVTGEYFESGPMSE